MPVRGTRERYVAQRCMSLTIAGILAESSVRHADRTAVVLGELKLSYAQSWAHALQYAAVPGTG